MRSDPKVDQADFRAWQHGDESAFDRLVSRWERPLFAFAWRYLHHAADAQDVVAETFVRLFQNRDRLRPDTRLAPWLFTTLANRCHNQARWRRRHPDSRSQSTAEDTDAMLDQRRDEAPTAEARLEQKEAVRHLQAAVDQLPHNLRVTVLLYYHEGLSYQEIAAITACSVRGVETRLYRARRRLRTVLGPLLDEGGASTGSGQPLKPGSEPAAARP